MKEYLMHLLSKYELHHLMEAQHYSTLNIVMCSTYVTEYNLLIIISFQSSTD